MKIEVEMTEDGGFIVKNAQGKLWVAREYNLLKRIREAFNLPPVDKHNIRSKPSESLPPTPEFSKKSLRKKNG